MFYKSFAHTWNLALGLIGVKWESHCSLFLLIDLDFTSCFSSPSLALQLPLPSWPGHQATPRATLTILPPLPLQSSEVPGPISVPWFPLSHPQLISMAACATWILAQLPGPRSLPSLVHPLQGLQGAFYTQGWPLRAPLLLEAPRHPRHSPWTWSGSAPSLQGCLSDSFLSSSSTLQASPENYLQFLLHKASGFDWSSLLWICMIIKW